MHSFLLYSSRLLVPLAVAMIAGCADSATAQNPVGSPLLLRSEHTTAASDPGSSQAAESKSKSRVTERRTVESKSSRGGDSGGPSRPQVDRRPPRGPNPPR